MAKRKIDKQVMIGINEFIEQVRKHYTIDAVYLFGSYAKGTNHEHSDLDIDIVSKDITNRLDDRAKLFVIASDFELLIEPHPYNTSEFNADEYMIVHEIIKHGIKVA
jgi:predicted nucleotidyltransferase